ncbi:MAG: PASTA domain-containing protein [Gemmatimonadota bacterium]
MKRLLRTVAIALGVLLGTAVLYLALLDEFIMPWFVNVERVTVPAVTGLSLERAADRARQKGLRLAILDSAYHETAPAGQVVDQTPDSRSQIKRGRRVFVTVSRGQHLYQVPEVTGGSARDAVLQVQGHQLQVGAIRYRSSGSVPEGVVITQHPVAGAAVSRGTIVTLEVSSGSPFAPKRVPALVGRPIEVVEDSLAKYELRLGTISERPRLDVPPGRVLSQEPVADSRVPRDTPVNLVVSTGAAPDNAGEGH